MVLKMNNTSSRFLAIVLISLLTNLFDIKSVFPQSNNEDSDNLIYLGKNQYNKSVFIERNSVKQWGNGDEYWFRIAWEHKNLYYFLDYRGSCASAAVKPLSVTVKDSVKRTKYQENYKKGWIYPERESILRNALSIGCQVIFQRNR
jgi:hypothetical protein